MSQDRSEFPRRIFLMILLFFAVLLSPPSLQAQDSKLKLASFNAMFLYDEVQDENGFPKNRIPRTASDFERIQTHLRKIDPDILAVQEVENETAALKILTDSYSCFVTKTQLYKQEVGICWKKKFYPKEIRLYPELSVAPGARPGMELRIPIGKTIFSFLSVHLKAGHSPNDRDLRSRQLKILNGILKEKKNYFVLGDLNVPLGNDKKSWKILSEGLNLRNPGRYTKQICWGHRSLIDLILTDHNSSKMKFEQKPFPEDDGNFDGKPEGESGLSDHCPVVLEINLED
ncbi:endonuclease/exonuclease/phosphatase family protein [Leptospira sp. WS92.C1]